MNMNKYALLKEHKEVNLYGRTPKEALERAGLIPRADKYIKDGKMYGNKLIADYRPQDDIIINEVVGEEDTSGVSRGDKKIRRMICDTSIGIIAIDVCDTGAVITPAE